MAQPARRSTHWLMNEPALQIMPSVACCFGVDEAIFLQQVHFWLRTSKHFYDGRYWIYNTLPEWMQQMPFFKERTLQRVISELKRAGVLLISQDYNARPGDRTNWYSIDFDVFDAKMEEWYQAQQEEEEEAIPSRQNGVMVTPKWRHGDAKMAYSYRTEKNTTEKNNNIRSSGEDGPPPSPQTDVEVTEKSPPIKPADHPAVQAYRALYERYPTKAQMKIIAQQNPPLDKWQLAITKWAARKYDPGNIEGMLEWAFDPSKMDRKPKRKEGGGIYVDSNEVTTQDQAEIDANDAWAREAYPERFLPKEAEKE